MVVVVVLLFFHGCWTVGAGAVVAAVVVFLVVVFFVLCSKKGGDCGSTCKYIYIYIPVSVVDQNNFSNKPVVPCANINKRATASKPACLVKLALDIESAL